MAEQTEQPEAEYETPTDEEKRVEAEYEQARHRWLERGMLEAQAVFQNHRESPLYVITETRTETKCYSMPVLMDALTAALRIGPPPVMPSSVRRPSSPLSADLIAALMNMANSMVLAWSQSRQPQEPPPAPPGVPQEPPIPADAPPPPQD
jgi:hypothetical protein